MNPILFHFCCHLDFRPPHSLISYYWPPNNFNLYLFPEYPSTTRATPNSATNIETTTISKSGSKCLWFRCIKQSPGVTTHSTNLTSTTSSITYACTSSDSEPKWSTTTITNKTKPVKRLISCIKSDYLIFFLSIIRNQKFYVLNWFGGMIEEVLVKVKVKFIYLII